MVSGYLMTRVSCSGFRLRVWVLEGTFGVCWARSRIEDRDSGRRHLS